MHGVTSAGKTEIYIHLITEALERGEQVLFMLPEIALTKQITERLRRVFGNKIGVYHSKFSDAERVEIWGLPIVRTSPDHGTAYEMAGRDQADPRSMISAIYAAIDIYKRREAYDDLIENRMTIKMPDTEIKPKGGRIIE